MANLYESDQLNIVAAYYEETDDSWHIQVQRLPLSTYPDVTDIFINSDSLSNNLSKADFISSSLPLISSKLTEFDNNFNGSSSLDIPTGTYIQKYTD